MKMAVIGAGLMGRAALYDLAKDETVEQVIIFDLDVSRAEEVARRFGNGKAEGRALNAADEAAVAAGLDGCKGAVACTTYQHNPGLTRAAVKVGCHLVDLGGNNDVVRTQMEMNGEAEKAGIIGVPDCGLAPGMVSLMVADAVEQFETVSAARIRVGGLPQVPRGLLKYQMVFSAEGLLNEYWEPCVILEGGKRQTVNPMAFLEQLSFDGIGDLEAFTTSGGTSTLPDSFAGKIDYLDYKTIRYPGHCVQFRTMLELGLASRKMLQIDGQAVEPRALFRAVLDHNLSFNEPDLVLLRVTVEGTKGGQATIRTYEIVDRQDSRTGLTAMMRCTAFPAAIIALLAATDRITVRGVKPQEVAVKPSLFLPQLKKRGINLTITDKPA